MGLPRREIDDGLTLYYLLGRPDVELVGVTTTFGNGPVDAIYSQTVHMLHDMGHPEMPVLHGAGQRYQKAASKLADNRAAQFLVDSAAAHPGEVTVLATGPLGNLYAAAQLDHRFFSQLKQIVCMGGYQHPLRIGWRNLAELNFSADPGASWSVLRQEDCPVTIMNAHICLQAPFGRRELARMQGWKYDVHRLTRNWLWSFGLNCGVTRFYLWDLLPAVYISYPELFDQHTVLLNSTVAALESGTLVVAQDGTGTPVNMPSHIIDSDRFMAVLFEAWAQVLTD
jgi:inosine-uridine nucleoside N-ribohydrolase